MIIIDKDLLDFSFSHDYCAKDQKELMSQCREANNSVISNVLIKKNEFGPFSNKNTFSNRNFTKEYKSPCQCKTDLSPFFSF